MVVAVALTLFVRFHENSLVSSDAEAAAAAVAAVIAAFNLRQLIRRTVFYVQGVQDFFSSSVLLSVLCLLGLW